MVKTINDVIALFKYSASWSAAEALLYQSLFLIHYSLLFYCIGASNYGIFSTGISLLYAWLMIGNLGFDQTLAPFFLSIKSTASSFKYYFGVHWIIQLCIISLSSLIFYFCLPFIMPDQFIQNRIVMFIMPFLLFSESMKKSLRIVLQLALKNKITAFIEIITIASYMLIVWTYYLVYRQASLELLILPLFITSLISCGGLYIFVYHFFQSLPLQQEYSFQDENMIGRIIKNRFFATFYIITQQLFSSNILIPAIAYNSGMKQAGVFNMLSTVIYSITHVFHKMSASSSLAAFAWAKRQTLAFKQEMFSLVWNELSKIASLASILLIVNQIHVTTGSWSLTSKDILLQGYLYIGILIIEFFAVTYEKFYLNEEKAHQLALLQFLVILLGSLTLWYGKILNTTIILELLFSIRLISFIIVMIQSFRIWKLKPHWKSSGKILLYGLPLAMLLYWTLKIIIRSIQ